MNDHPNALPAGYRLGEYEIQTVLGIGGFGITYKARDCKLSKLVAIKEYLPSDFAVRDGRMTVKPKNSASKDNYAWGLERFLDEARALARFDHPHINKVHRFIEANGTAYLVLEYIEGDMLSDLLNDKGRFNETGVRRMLDELLDGLAAVHKAGYVHRDIKPANIIFRRDGSAVLLDFGAARQARGQTVTVVFTECYAPVEQHFSKSDALGASSDLYSLGVVAYRCLLGGNENVLMDARERAHWINQGKAEKDMSPAVVVGKDNYSAGLLRAIDWAMKVDAKDRPQSVGELRVALAGKSTQSSVANEEKQQVTNEEKQQVTVEDAAEQLAKEKRSFFWKVWSPANARKVERTCGATHLHIAAAHGWTNLVQWLIDEGASVHAQLLPEEKRLNTRHRLFGVSLSSTRNGGAQPLHFAAGNNHADVVKQLLVAGADVNAITRFSKVTPLHVAAKYNGAQSAKQLLISGADVNYQSTWGTPLHYAADVFFHAENTNGVTAVADLLIAAGAKVNAKNKYGKAPLHSAATHKTAEFAKCLIAAGADINLKTSESEIGFQMSTPLHIAAWTNSFEAAKFLLANGADVTAKDKCEKTPLDSAKEMPALAERKRGKREMMVALLQQHGAK